MLNANQWLINGYLSFTNQLPGISTGSVLDDLGGRRAHVRATKATDGKVLLQVQHLSDVTRREVNNGSEGWFMRVSR